METLLHIVAFVEQFGTCDVFENCKKLKLCAIYYVCAHMH